MSESANSDFDSRLAVLEERTKPKEKTILDRIKDWSGVLTFVVAVLYTYPLGVWDRFVVTAEQQKIKEIGELRATIVRVTELDSETFRVIASDCGCSAASADVSGAKCKEKRVAHP